MEKVLGIGGMFFRARDPQKLARWYSDHLGIDIREAVWHQQAGPTVFMPFQYDTDYFGQPEQQWMINFRVGNLDAMIAQLEASSISVETKAEWNSEIGRFARIHDPEGNPIELWEPRAVTAVSEVPTELLFSYGTLQLDAVQMATFGRQLAGTSDALERFELVPLTIADESVVAISGKAVHTMAKFTGRTADVISGTVFRVSPDELRNADRYEVAAVKRVALVLQSGVTAWVYVDARYAPSDS
jgi:predicted enzyme related to lactoylglutathione lyase